MDRLLDLGSPAASGESGSAPLLGDEELRASVRREVAHVLGTRCTLTLEQAESLEPHERTVLDYGLPDLGPLGSTPADAQRLERIIARAVEAYEPRLHRVRVSVQPPLPEEGTTRAMLSARLARPGETEPLSLWLRLDRSGRLVEVDDER